MGCGIDLVVSNPGERFLLARALALPGADYGALKLHAYSNDLTPNRDTDLADIVESVWSGYAPVVLGGATWTSPETQDGAAVSSYGTGVVQITATSGTAFVYGAFTTNNAGTILIWSWRFDSVQMVNSTNPLSLLVGFGARSQSEPPPP